MRRVALALVLLAAAPGPAGQSSAPDADAAGIAAFAWLVGTWADGAGETEEHWLPARGGAMLGVNRTVTGGEMVFFEYLRIETDDRGRVIYQASPLGRHPPTPFVLVESGTASATFKPPLDQASPTFAHIS